MTQSALAKERRELREQQQRTALEAIPKDLSRPWEDPLPEPGERHLAQVPSTPSIQETIHANVHINQVHHDTSALLKLLRGISLSGNEAPRLSCGKASQVAYEIIVSR